MEKTSLKFRLEQNTLKEFYLISPDGFSLHDGVSYVSGQYAMADFLQWKERFRSQGYYSSVNGRIALDDLEFHIKINSQPFHFDN